MIRSICIIDGHPDPARHFIHALCDAYAAGAATEGHTVERIDVGALDVPILATPQEFAEAPPEPVLSEREKIARADHLLIAFPLWLGGMPAKLKAFLEQAARAEFFLGTEGAGWPKKMMKGKSARIVVTMGMPDLVYRFGMDAGALKALERGVLGLSGFSPMHHTVIGGAGDLTESRIGSWLEFMRELGERAV